MSQFKIEIEKPFNRPRFQGREAPWLLFIKIEVKKPLSCHNLGSNVEKPFGYLSSKNEIKKPLNCPRFRGRKAPWLPFIKIEVKKPLGHHNSRLR